MGVPQIEFVKSEMGLSESLTSVVVPMPGADVEKLSCSELTDGSVPKQQFCLGEECNLADCSADGAVSSDASLGFCQDENAAQMNGNCDNVDASQLKKLVGDQFGIDVCDLENDLLCSDNGGPPDQDDRGSKDMFPGLSQHENAVCVSALDCDGSQDEVDVCNLQKDCKSICGLSVERFGEEKKDGLTKIDNKCCDQTLLSEGYGKSSEVMPMTGSPNNHMAQNNEKESKSVDSCTLQGFIEAVEKRSEEKRDDQTKTDNDIQMLPSQGRQMSLELISLTDEMRSCSQPDKQKDNKGSSCPTAGGFIEDKCEVLAGVGAKPCNQMPPLGDCGLPSESIGMTSYLSSGAHQDELMYAKSVSSPTLDGRADVSFVTESYMCNPIATSDCARMPTKLSYGGDLVSHYLKDDQSNRGYSLENFTKTVETNSYDDLCLQLLPSRSCLGVLESLNVAESLNNTILQNIENDNDKIVAGPSTDSGVKFSEYKSDVTTVVNFESGTELLHVENNACNSKEDVSQVMSYLGEKSSYAACEPFGSKNISSRRFDLSDSFLKDASGAINSNCAVDHSSQTENEGKDVVRANCVLETIFTAPVSSSSRGDSRKSKSSQRTLSKRVTKNCRKTVKEPYPQESINFTSKVSRRKRSCYSKPARSSIWGLLGDVAHCPVQHHEPEFDEVQNQGSQRARGSGGNRKGIKNPGSKSRKTSSKRTLPSTSCLRFKVKIGKGICQSYLNSRDAEVAAASASVDASFCNHGSELCQETTPTYSVEDNLAELGTERHLQYSKNPEKVMTCQDASVMDVKLGKKDFESTKILQMSAGDATEGCLGMTSNAVVETSGGATVKNYMDPGTSPDSEVINPVPDSQVGMLHQEGLHNTVLTTSEDIASPGDVKRSKSRKREKKDNQRSLATASVMKPKSSKNCRGRQKDGDSFYSSENLYLSTNAEASSVSLSSKDFSIEPLHLSSENEIGVSTRIENGVEGKASCSHDASELQYPKNLIHSRKKGHRHSKGSKSCAVSTGRSKVIERSKKRNASRQRENQQKSGRKSRVKENDLVDGIESREESQPESGNGEVDDVGNTNSGKEIESAVIANVNAVSDGTMEQWVLPDSAWVRCDDCYKWRRIPFELEDKINGTCRWICKDNMDKAFADCSIPQEKSNADINAELGLSDPDEDGYDGHLNYKGLEYRNTAVRQSSVFRRIDSNEFLHRRRKTQTIDEIMVCHCKPPPDGQLGCRDECLNRMLNIECVQGTCPCGDLCSNQQFQKRKYAKMEWVRCGKKGYGLKMFEDISAGQFLIEYVGEVLDLQAYGKRQKEYASTGQRHFYFMTLNGSEVIDACAKGNLGRFINHSCDPNCRTEKWMVNGEICIGLFALRDIKQGEEVTFDYNYVRVFGAAAKKCHCQSPHCRGYIGGDPLNAAEVIVEDDSDEEYPEPVMLEDGDTWDVLENTVSRSSSFDGTEMQTAESLIKDRRKKDNSTVVVGHSESTIETEHTTNHSASSTVQLLGSIDTEDLKGNFQSSIQQAEVSLKTEDVRSEPISTIQHGDAVKEMAMSKSLSSNKKLDPTSLTLSVCKLPSGGVDASKKSKFDNGEDRQASLKTPLVMKISRSSSSVKKGKVSNPLNGNKFQLTANKNQVMSIKPRKSVEGSSNGHFEAVEEKLNELLDADGGISKRRDAAKGYLKLLLLTAASGDSVNGEAIQSNRELSMILDALLKTKSRAVLTDIINKNGLRMLHNIMKQYRRDFKKIPILRKLLKILEYLAVREILTLEHINGGPPCHGMESFRESMLSLTEHEDKQVHQIARSFRDKWIPKPVRKPGYKGRDEGRMDFHRDLNCSRGVSASQNHWHDQGVKPTEVIDDTHSVLATTSGTAVHDGCSSSADVCQATITRVRKRKSRWDQPADPDPRLLKQKEQKVETELEKKLGSSPLPVLGEIADHDHLLNHSQQDEDINAKKRRQTVNEDVPPGFSSPQPPSLVSSHASPAATDLSQPTFFHLKCPPDIFIAHPQKKFNSRLPVSYGFPVPIMQQFGSSQAEGVESWVIAPGMPFHPFPPLPPFPRNKKEIPLGNREAIGDGQQDGCGPATCCPDANSANPADHKQPESDIPVNNQQTFKRARDSSYDLGKKYFRQQKRKGPPWLKYQSMGNNYMVWR